MSDPHWENLKAIFHAAVSLAPNERYAYLDRACNGDASLRQAVESLIKSHEETGFVDEPGYEAAAEMLVNGAEFQSGAAVAHYKIFSLLGEGGMGKVYLAQDTKLNRKVALKFLPTQLATNQDHLRRFTQEAKSAAALHHPNIAQIFEIGKSDGAQYIAMEYVEGETLRQHLSRRKLNLKKAVEFAAQVASGLATAHRAGVIHRDVKPENLVVTASGQVKILDFGLAKLVDKERGAEGVGELTTAYMQSGDATTPGAILGTVSYMSPEQARAEKLDQRTDIFSLGVVLYEMVTGERPFTGKSAIDTLHAIINKEPPRVSDLNPQLPPELTDILGKALAKDTSERYQHAGDFELDLRRFKRALESNSLISTQIQGAAKARGRPTSGFTLPLLGVGLLIVIGVAIGGWLLGRLSVATKRATMDLENMTLTPITSDPGYEGEPTFSPDGETIAYVSDRYGNLEIYLKQISGGADINLTNDAKEDVQPSFSPDGKQIAFVSTRASKSDLIYRAPGTPLMGGDVWVMRALGGSPRRIVEEGNFPSWSPDGKNILYTAGQWGNYKILSVSASGGAPSEIPVKWNPNEPVPLFIFYPSYSSDGRWILFESQNATIYVVSAGGGEPQRIAQGRRPVWSANSESVIFSNTEPGKNFSLWRVPFSIAEGKLNGAPQPLTVGRGRDTQAAVSPNGKLIAFAVQDVSFNIESAPFDAETGRMTGPPQALTGGDNRFYFFDVSPDGGSIVAESHRGGTYSIWRIGAGAPPVQLTSDPNSEDRSPKWSPDGNRVAFLRTALQAPAKTNMWLMAADGANPQLLFESTGDFRWTPDGHALVYYSPVDRQVYAFDLTTRDKRQVTNELGVMQKFSLSCDGKWLLYQSTLQSGVPRIRAMPLASGAALTVAVTPGENYHPFLSPSGRWLYFQPDHKNLYRVPGPTQDWRSASPEKVTDFPASNLYLEDPQFSRDGRRLFFSRGRITSDIWIMSFGK